MLSLPYVCVRDLVIGHGARYLFHGQVRVLPLMLHPYGLLVAGVVAVAAFRVLRGARREGYSWTARWTFAVLTFGAAAFAGHVAYLLETSPMALFSWLQLALLAPGTDVGGALVGCAAGVLAWRLGAPLWSRNRRAALPLVDHLAEGLSLAWPLGGLASWIAHSRPGQAMAGPLSTSFPSVAPVFDEGPWLRLLCDGEPRLDRAVLETLLGVALAILAVRRRREASGLFAARAAALFGVGELAIEAFGILGPRSGLARLGASFTQIVAGVCALVGLAVLLVHRRRARSAAASPRGASPSDADGAPRRAATLAWRASLAAPVVLLGAALPRPMTPIPAPILKPAAALASMRIVPGFQVHLVAAEPLVQEPVAAAFDANGRLWVAEMTGYMESTEGDSPTPRGNVVVLDDADGDGAMDRRTVFASGLRLPRAVAPVRDGVIVGEPPHLWFMRDTNGDGVADAREEIAADFTLGNNPEWEPNGGLTTVDGWIVFAQWPYKVRFVDGHWQRTSTTVRGQFGIDQDEWGRLYFNNNAVHLQYDALRDDALGRNPHHVLTSSANLSAASSEVVRLNHVTPGANRAEKPGLLAGGMLSEFTAASGVHLRISAGGTEGFAFVSEPVGNIVRRERVVFDGVRVSATKDPADPEFLESSDERFRPVNTFGGPDGAVYVVDMYHGVLQHVTFLTSYLRQYSVARGLEGSGWGRIYRISEAGHAYAAPPRLATMKDEDLVRALGSDAPWTRTTAQRLLVERRSTEVVAPLKRMVAEGPPAGGARALWTLATLGALDDEVIASACRSASPLVVASALHAAAHEGRVGAEPTSARLVLLAEHASMVVRMAAAAALAASRDAAASKAVRGVLERDAGEPIVVDAVLGGARDHELEILQGLLDDASPSWRQGTGPHARVLELVAAAVAASGNADAARAVLRRVSDEATTRPARSAALLRGMTAAAEKQTIALSADVVELETLCNSADDTVKRAATDLRVRIKAGIGAGPPPAAYSAQFERGKARYASTCAPCHQADGRGKANLAPPLKDSEWTAGPPSRALQIVLRGLHGPIHVAGTEWSLDMPALGNLDDDTIADVLTYVRWEFGKGAGPVTSGMVQSERRQAGMHTHAVSEQELRSLKR